MAPAYTYEQPLRRYARVAPGTGRRDARSGRSARSSPASTSTPARPVDWTPGRHRTSTSVPWGKLAPPFVFSHIGPSRSVRRRRRSRTHSAVPTESASGTIVASPSSRRNRSASVSFVLPAGLDARAQQPARRRAPRTLDGDLRRATAEGIAWQRELHRQRPPSSSRDTCASRSRPAAARRHRLAAAAAAGCRRTGWSGPPAPPGSCRIRRATALSRSRHYVKLRNRYG